MLTAGARTPLGPKYENQIDSKIGLFATLITSLSLCGLFCLSVCVSVCLAVFLSFDLTVGQLVCHSVVLSVFPSVGLSVSLSVGLPIDLDWCVNERNFMVLFHMVFLS